MNKRNPNSSEDKILRKIVLENEEIFDDIRKKDVPDFDEMMKSVEKTSAEITASGNPYDENAPYPVTRKKKKNRRFHFSKALPPVAAMLILFIAAISFKGISVDASKVKVFNTLISFRNGQVTINIVDSDSEKVAEIDALDTQFFTSLEDAVNKIDKPFYIPEYMPDGYNFFKVEYTSDPYDNYYVKYTYETVDGGLLRIDQRKYHATSTITDNTFREDIFNDEKVYYIINEDAKNVFWREGNREIYLMTTINDDEIVKIIKNMKLKSR